MQTTIDTRLDSSLEGITMLGIRHLLLIAALTLTGGCTTYTKVVQVGPGSAYVVSRENGSEKLLNCHVVDDQPKCWRSTMKGID